MVLFTTGTTCPPPMLKSSDFFWNVLWLVAEFLNLAPADILQTSWLILNGFACNLHNSAQFCKTIETMGNKQPYVLTTTTHTSKYLDKFLTVCLETFTTGFVFAKQSKQGVATLCLDQNYTSNQPRYLGYPPNFCLCDSNGKIRYFPRWIKQTTSFSKTFYY